MSDEPDRNSPHYANRTDVKFDDATSDALANACRNTARDLRDKIPNQSSKAEIAQANFKGYFSELYKNNIRIAVKNGNEIADILDQLATAVDNLKEAAHKEQKAREDARHYEDDWFGFFKSWDNSGGQRQSYPTPIFHILLSRNLSQNNVTILLKGGRGAAQGLQKTLLQQSHLI